MAGSNRLHKPRHGSLQFWPHARAKKETTRVRNWTNLNTTKLLGFLGYKVGMTHALIRDNKSTSLTKGMQISIPVTIIECPPIKPLSIRFYKHTPYGSKVISELFSTKVDKIFHISKKPNKEPAEFDDIKLLVYTQPKLTGFKKQPNVLELALSGKKEEKLKLAKELLEKEIKVSEVFKAGQFVDVHAVTTGKGFQGTVKKSGVKIRRHKSEGTRRGVGTLGPWTPSRVNVAVAQPGKIGYHTRTECNKWLLKISTKPEEVIPKGGFMHYGNVKNEYIILKGSIPGPTKRVITLTEPTRFNGKPLVAEITAISLESKQ